MIQLAISSFLIGAVFGLRFKVMVVLPLTAIGGFATVVVSLLLGHTTAAVVLSLLAFAAALQAGYLFGSFARFTLAALRTGRDLPVRLPLKSGRRIRAEYPVSAD